MKKPPKLTTTAKEAAIQSVNPLWIIGLLAFLVYSNTLVNDFALDDGMMITSNQFTTKGLKGIPDILTHDVSVGAFGTQKLMAGARYRPLSQVIFAVQYELSGKNAFAGHLVNALFFALACMLLYKLLHKLIRHDDKRWWLGIPFAASLIYAVHPIHTEVVANIKSLDEILSLSFSLASLWFVATFAETGKTSRIVIASLMLFLGLLSKENAATMILILPLMLHFFDRRFNITNKTRIYSTGLAAFGITILVYLFIRALITGFNAESTQSSDILNNPFVNATPVQKFATIIYTWGRYIYLLFIPYPLTVDYYPMQIPLMGFDKPKVLLSLLLVVLLAIWAIRGFRKKRIISFAILFFFLTFSMTSNLVINLGTPMNERFMFMPSVGFSIAMALLVRLIASIPGNKAQLGRNAASLILIIISSVYATLTIARNFDWKDDFTLFTRDVRVSVNSAKCNAVAGALYLTRSTMPGMEGKKTEYIGQAKKFLGRSVDIYPGYYLGYMLLGQVYLEEGDPQQASVHFIRSLNIKQDNREALYYLDTTALLMKKNQDTQGALRAYRALSLLQPDQPAHRINLADQYSRTGSADTAVIILRGLLSEQPQNGLAWGKLGEIYSRVFRDYANAVDCLLKSIMWDKKNPKNFENLGVAYFFRNDSGNSLKYLNIALEMNPADPGLLKNLALVYGNSGNMEKYHEFMERAKALNPGINP